MNIKIKKIGLYILLIVVLITYFFVRLPELRYSFDRGITAPTDFMQDYIAAKQVLAGKSVYPYDFMAIFKSILSRNGIKLDQSKFSVFVNAHPPFMSILLLPLGLLSFRNAIFLWSIVTICSMLLIIFILIKTEGIPLLYLPLISICVFAWTPFQTNLYYGQVSILITLFVITGWYFLKKGKEEMSGIFIALATMLKFYPGLLIVYFIINKRYKAFFYSIIGISLILVLTFVVNKHDFIYFYFNRILFDVNYHIPSISNLSIGEFFNNLFLSVKTYYNNGTFIVSVNPFYRNIFLYSSEALLLLYLVVSIRKYDYNNELGFSIFIILSLILSPICWDHYLTLLLLPLIVLIKKLIKKNTLYEMLIFLTALFLISIDTDSVYFHKVMDITHFFIPGNPMSFIYRMTFYSAQFYGMVLLLILNFRLIKQSHKSTSEPPANQS